MCTKQRRAWWTEMQQPKGKYQHQLCHQAKKLSYILELLTLIVLLCLIVGLGELRIQGYNMWWGRRERRGESNCPEHKSQNKAEPQQIVAQRLLSCLQYPAPAKSFTEDLTQPTFHVVF
jgi:hypothetical protein